MKKAYALGLGVLLAIAGATFAQIPTGTLTGQVTSAEAALPGVTVTVNSAALQGARTTTTEGNGDYLFPYLPPGTYNVSFELEGFATVTQEVKISAGQQTRMVAEMAQASVSEEIVVTGSYETLSTTPQASVTYEKKFIEELPVNRTVIGATTLTPGVSLNGPNGQISISGNMSFENLFLVNGVVVNENLRGQPFDLFIEDAIEETNVSTSGISAEYGRFAGGVINTITRSGGNDFSASFRTSFSNADWVSETPLTTSTLDKVNKVFEATAGGFFLRDKVWFFGAARDFDTELDAQTAAPFNIPYANADSQTRLEGKLTISPFEGHRVVGSYLDLEETDGGNVFPPVLDLASVVTRELPQKLMALNYTGVVTSNFFVEAQYSEREFAFIGSGSQFTDRVQGTLLINNANQRWNSPTFCGVCIPEERNNENLLAKASYFLSTDSLGSHQLTLGYDTFDDIRAADNHQSGSDYRLLAVDAIPVNGVLFPRIIGAPTGTAVTIIQYNPIFQSTRGNQFTTNSAYLNDAWSLNDRFSFNLGLRYDENDGSNQAGAAVIKDSKVSPRIGVTWDLTGDAKWILNGSYGTYVAAIANNQADSSSSAGNPAAFQWNYRGPSVNATGTPTVPVDQALNILWAWFDSVGGPANTLFLRNNPTIPGGTTAIAEELGSPDTDEYVLGISRRLGSRGMARVDLVHRESGDFYMTRSAGRVTLPNGRVADFSLLTNDSGKLSREYDGIHLDARYRISDRIDVGGNYTYSELEGNIDGETQANATISSALDQYPEYKAFARHNPSGNLATDQRHRARVFGSWRVFDTTHHQLSIGGLHTFFTGVPYGAVGNINSSPFVTNPGYVVPPTAVAYYFTDRDAFRTDDVHATDLSINYSFLFNAWGQDFEMFLQPEMLNVFNNDGVLGTNTNFNTAVQTASTAGSGLQSFNPFTTTPVEGVHWRKGPLFGTPTNPNVFQTPRTFRFSVGFRF